VFGFVGWDIVSDIKIESKTGTREKEGA